MLILAVTERTQTDWDSLVCKWWLRRWHSSIDSAALYLKLLINVINEWEKNKGKGSKQIR